MSASLGRSPSLNLLCYEQGIFPGIAGTYIALVVCKQVYMGWAWPVSLATPHPDNLYICVGTVYEVSLNTLSDRTRRRLKCTEKTFNFLYTNMYTCMYSKLLSHVIFY